MKKIIPILLLLIGSFQSFSQSCEERELKLVAAIGSFSSALLYNTYGLIGSIADGYGQDVYDVTTTNDLLAAQRKLAGNLVIVLENLSQEQSLQGQFEKEYAAAAIAVLKGLDKQAQLMQEYVKKRNQSKLEAYSTQRDKNWKDISRLMGLPG